MHFFPLRIRLPATPYTQKKTPTNDNRPQMAPVIKKTRVTKISKITSKN